MIKDLYKQWCKETKRNGGVLVGGSINEFFDWLEDNNYYVSKYVEYSDSFQKSIQSIEDNLKRK